MYLRDTTPPPLASPKDFYNFLLHKLIHRFEAKIAKGILVDPYSEGSYVRLSKFIWERSYVKKAIMTTQINIYFFLQINTYYSQINRY